MNKELDPKIIGIVVVVVIAIAAVGLYLGTKGQADRSGPPVVAKYQGGKGPGGGGGWHPGATQAEVMGGGSAGAPGSNTH